MSGRHAAGPGLAPPIDSAARLRTAFDSSFAVPVRGEARIREDLLAIRVGDAAYALRQSEITGLYVNRRITALPGAPAELLGIAGFRGAIVAVYDLRVLLGLENARPCPWIVLAAPDSVIGLAFDRFEMHLRVPRTSMTADHVDSSGGPEGHLAVDLVDTVRPIASIPALLNALVGPRSSTDKDTT